MNEQNNKEPGLAIRFLKSGFIPVREKPEGFHNMTLDEKVAWADNILAEQTDQELITAMADFENPDKNGYFDDTFTVEAIQDPSQHDTPHESIYATPLWNAFITPDYGDNIIHESKILSQFIESLGFPNHDIEELTQQQEPNNTRLDALKLLDNAYNKTLQAYREEHGEMLVQKILNDADAPQLLKDLIVLNEIDHIGFEKVTVSHDHMPDHCTYIYLSSKHDVIGVQTSMKSDNWDECSYEYGIYEIREAMYFSDVINSNELVSGYIATQEGAVAYEYLIKLLEGLDETTLDKYLLEREG